MNNIEGQISFFDNSIKDSHKFKAGDKVLFKYGWGLDEKGNPRNFIYQGEVIGHKDNYFCIVEFEYKGQCTEIELSESIIYKVIE